MDAQLKRGLLEICVLRVLQRGDSYGYQIIKDVSSCLTMSESTLYPILKRLETAQALTVYNVEHNGRLRKYYHITPAGEQRVADFLLQWQEVMRVYQFIKEQDDDEKE